jgi:competence protein ComEA
LIKLPGIGPKTAEKIIILRTQKGGFSRVDELTEVKGIGLKKLNKIKSFLFIE